ncbi:lipopolysaccharide transport periplasmic protein LptA [Persephonella sp. KM09-Lau-8]|uniref:lipopolysaccharide transport periplasmic protein LptA n=1 Tax=Persephonella sp. KM09-Lau-8 TaxID=1158345 RepID=UPI0004964CEE|nr:lipopolysaccharide transport periplasmic protein LptA [Persephonella sp. KM09-Lau-8]
MLRFLLAFFILVGTTYAETTEGKKQIPIVIEADTLNYSKKDNLLIYKGNVIVKKEDFILHSDTLKILLDQKGDISRIIAIGHVHFKKGNRTGKSDKAEYFKDKNYIILTGNAQLQQNNNIIEGEKIVYYLDTEKAEVVGQKKRVRTIFFPKEEKGEK